MPFLIFLSLPGDHHCICAQKGVIWELTNTQKPPRSYVQRWRKWPQEGPVWTGECSKQHCDENVITNNKSSTYKLIIVVFPKILRGSPVSRLWSRSLWQKEMSNVTGAIYYVLCGCPKLFKGFSIKWLTALAVFGFSLFVFVLLSFSFFFWSSFVFLLLNFFNVGTDVDQMVVCALGDHLRFEHDAFWNSSGTRC